jgi:hypothetical protein
VDGEGWAQANEPRQNATGERGSPWKEGAEKKAETKGKSEV